MGKLPKKPLPRVKTDYSWIPKRRYELEQCPFCFRKKNTWPHFLTNFEIRNLRQTGKKITAMGKHIIFLTVIKNQGGDQGQNYWSQFSKKKSTLRNHMPSRPRVSSHENSKINQKYHSKGENTL